MNDIGNIDGSIEAVQGGPSEFGGDLGTADGAGPFGGIGGDPVSSAEQSNGGNVQGTTGFVSGSAISGNLSYSQNGVTISGSVMEFTSHDAAILGGIIGAAILAGPNPGKMAAAAAVAIVGMSPDSTNAISHLAHDYGTNLVNAFSINPGIVLFDTAVFDQTNNSAGGGYGMAASADGSQVSIWDPSRTKALTIQLNAGAAINVYQVQPNYLTYNNGGNSEAGGM